MSQNCLGGGGLIFIFLLPVFKCMSLFLLNFFLVIMVFSIRNIASLLLVYLLIL